MRPLMHAAAVGEVGLITRAEPAVLEGRGRVERTVPVALHHLGTAHEELVVGAELHFAVGHGMAHAVGVVVLHAGEGDDGRGFGEAIELQDVDAERAEEACDGVVEACAARKRGAQAAAEDLTDFGRDLDVELGPDGFVELCAGRARSEGGWPRRSGASRSQAPKRSGGASPRSSLQARAGASGGSFS